LICLKKIPSFPASAAILLLLFNGCSSPLHVPSPALTSEYHSSRTGLLKYRIPAGWVDVTRSAQGSSRHVWILSHDYDASIEVNEVQIDAEVRAWIQREGLFGMAASVLKMAGSEGGVRVVDSLSFFTQGEVIFWTFETDAGSGGVQRVMLFDTGTHCMEVRVWNKKDGPQDTGDIGRAFVGSLRW